MFSSIHLVCFKPGVVFRHVLRRVFFKSKIMKNGTSIALASEIELGEAKHLYRVQCLDALTKCKDKETKLKNSNKVKVEVLKIPYGYLTIYRRNKNKQ